METKRILIIGTGSIGERHLRCFQKRGAIVAACEPNFQLGERIASQYNCPWFSGLDGALAESFDAAIICTPAHTHVPIAFKCLKSNLGLLIEKPLSTSTQGLDDLAKESEAAGAVVRVGYVYRSFLVMLKARELLATGLLGDIKHVAVESGQHFPTFRPAYRTIYYSRHENGGGAIQDAMTHFLHVIEWLISPIRSVFCDAAHQVLEGVDVEDTVNISARLENKALASFSLNQFQAPNETVLSIHGIKGSLRIELHRSRVGIYLSGGNWEWHELEKEDRDGPFLRQADSFLEALAGRPDGLSSLAEGTQTLRVNIAALTSSRERREIQL